MGQLVCETLNYECHYNEWKWFFVLEDKFSNAIFVMLWLGVFFHCIGQLFIFWRSLSKLPAYFQDFGQLKTGVISKQSCWK